MKVSLFGLIAIVGASQFSSDLRGKKGCGNNLDAIKKVDSKVSKLEDCYGNSSLFFSPLSVACSPECFEPTVEAAQYLTRECSIKKPSKRNPMISHSELVYSSWADHDSASIICKTSQDNHYCLQEILRYAPQLASPENFPSHKQLKPELVCTECNQAIHIQFKDKPYEIPVVYYETMNDPEATLKALGKLCGWS